MSEPAKETPKTPKRSKRKPAMEPLGWDEIVSQPGMGGYLSFLNGPIPLPHLQGIGVATVPASTPGVVSEAAVLTTPEVTAAPQIVAEPGADVIDRPVYASNPQSIPGVDSIPDVIQPPPMVAAEAHSNSALGSVPGVAPTPVTLRVPEAQPIPGPDTIAVTPEVVSAPVAPLNAAAPQPSALKLQPPGVVSAPVLTAPSAFGAAPARQIRIRKCFTAQEGHSLGEEVLYQALWKAAAPEAGDSRTIIIGWRGMTQLCRMTPKNCKINTQRLIRKLALEVLSPYNTPESIGTTYRVYSAEGILQKRRAAGLEWVVRSRGVEFVDPASGQPHSAHLCDYVSS